MRYRATEHLVPAGDTRPILSIGEYVEPAAKTQRELGISGWRFLARVSLEEADPDTGQTSPLIVMKAGGEGSHRLPLAAASIMPPWVYDRDDHVGHAGLAVVGADYLQAVAGLHLDEYETEAEFDEQAGSLPPAAAMYLEPGQAFVDPNVGVMHVTPNLVLVAALGSVPLSVEYAIPPQ